MPSLDLHTEVHDGSGPFLLLVHGMLSNRAQWERNLAALSTVSRPVVVEVLGHGRSPSPEAPALYHPDVYVETFEALRESLGVACWALCGQSFGATLTMRYALHHPERVCAQIFTNSTSALADPQWEARVHRQLDEVIEAVEEKGKEGLEGLGFHPRHATRLPPDTHASLIREAETLDPAGVVRTLRYTIPHASLYGRVAENRVPTLLVCGEQERRFEPFRRYAERKMPRLEVVGLDAGHAVNIEHSKGFDRAVTDFLARHCAAKSG